MIDTNYVLVASVDLTIVSLLMFIEKLYIYIIIKREKNVISVICCKVIFYERQKHVDGYGYLICTGVEKRTN